MEAEVMQVRVKAELMQVERELMQPETTKMKRALSPELGLCTPKRPRPLEHGLSLKFNFTGEIGQREVLFLIPAQTKLCMPSLFIYDGIPDRFDWARFSKILILSGLPPAVHHFVYAYCKAVVTADGHFVSSRTLNALLAVIGVEFQLADATDIARRASSMISVNIVQR